jgi:cell division protein FtsB
MSARATATSPAEARGKRHEEPAKRGRILRLTPRATILGFVVFIAAIFAVAPARAYLDQRAERQRLAQQVQLLERQNGQLEQRLLELHDPVELERLARECLGMVRVGEIAVVPIREGRAPKPPICD